MLSGGVGGLFFIAFFTTRANSFGVAAGVIIAILATFAMTYIEAKAMVYDSRVNWLIEEAVDSGGVNEAAIRARIEANAEAQGQKIKLADLEKAEKEHIRALLADRIQAKLGDPPPHLGEAIGIHPFAMGLITIFLAFFFGYLFSFFRPAPSKAQIAGLTWWTRQMKRIE